MKPGDLVEILDGSNIPDYAGGWIPEMNNYIGTRAKVKRILDREVEIFGSGFTFDKRGLKPILETDDRTIKIHCGPLTQKEIDTLLGNQSAKADEGELPRQRIRMSTRSMQSGM